MKNLLPRLPFKSHFREGRRSPNGDGNLNTWIPDRVGDDTGRVGDDTGRVGDDTGRVGDDRGRVEEDKGRIGGGKERMRDDTRAGFTRLLSVVLLFIVLVGGLVGPVGVVKAAIDVDSIPENSPAPGQWVVDNDVTFAGKNAKRSGDLLDWVIANSDWSYIAPGAKNPFTQVWLGVRNTVFALVLLTIMVAAFTVIVTRGQNLGVRKYAVRLIIVMALIWLSYAIVSTLYALVDIIQGFFLRRGSDFIQSKDLLSVAFDYKDFLGYRKVGAEFDESAIVSLILVKLTAASYYAMFLVLMIRKIILWFFIIISPIFAMLFLFAPLRNSGKIWMGEFFRWLLYGPLFAVLLSGMVTFWQGWQGNVPLKLDGNPTDASNPATITKPAYVLPCSNTPSAKDNIYPTSINILLGGPCQAVTVDNNLNLPGSFIEYVIALVMIWMVILMPFILLKIFLDYFNNFSYSESNLAKYVAAARSSPLLERYRFNNGAGVSPPKGPLPAGSTGLARSIPELGQEKAAAIPVNISENVSVAEQVSQQAAETIDEELANSLSANLARSNNQFNTATQSSSENASQIASQSAAISVAQSATRASTQATTQASQAFNEGFNQASSQGTTEVSREASRVFNEGFNQASSETSSSTSSSSLVQDSEVAQILAQANLSIPNMTEIAKFETSILSADAATRAEASKVYEALNRIAGTSQITTPGEREQYSQISEKIIQQSSEGNPVASAVLAASSAAGQLTGFKISQLPKIVVKNYQSVGKITSNIQFPTLAPEMKIGQIKESLEVEAKAGNPVAHALVASVPVAGGSPSPESTAKKQAFLNQYEAIAKITSIADSDVLTEEQKLNQIHQALEREAKAGNPLAVSIVSVLTLASQAQIPETNAVQQVNLDDYEQVKKTWTENYRNLDAPPDINNNPRTRKEWLEQENSHIPQAINLLTSVDPNSQQQGKQMVSKILPFLLLGGFSKNEIVAYLKAKQEAAKAVLAEVAKSGSEEDLVERAKAIQKPKALTLEAEVEDSKPANPSPQPTSVGTNNPAAEKKNL